MELLNCSVDSRASKCLTEVFEQARLGNPESAFSSSFLYFEDLLPRNIGSVLDDSNGDKQDAISKNRHLRYGLIFNARLARYFGHFSKANYFVVEAIHLSQRCNDFLSLRLAILEQCALEICSSRHAMLGRFVRNESNFLLSENDNQNPILQFSNGVAPPEEGSADYVLALTKGQNLSEEEEDPSRSYLSQQISICEKYLRALFLTIRCESPESVTNLFRCCLAFDMGTDRAPHSKMVREAARAAITTIQVSNCLLRPSEVVHCLLDEICAQRSSSVACATLSKSVNTEAKAILFVNAAYAYALDGRFEKALSFIEMAKTRFTDDDNPTAAHHWLVAEVCIGFDFDFFYGRKTDIEILSCVSPTEADFRQALLSANNGDTFKALKIIKNRLNILQRGADVLLIIRCLMILGTIYCESEALKSGIKLLYDALAMAESCSQHLLAAMARRRIALANLANANKCNISEAEQCIHKCGVAFEKATAPRLERGMYYVTRFKLAALKDNTNALRYLDRAREIFAGHYPQLEKNVYEEGFTFSDRIANEKMRQLCRNAFNEKLQNLPEYLNWNLL